MRARRQARGRAQALLGILTVVREEYRNSQGNDIEVLVEWAAFRTRWLVEDAFAVLEMVEEPADSTRQVIDSAISAVRGELARDEPRGG